jgi:chromatin structure-remodeling complex subunit RSC1/2
VLPGPPIEGIPGSGWWGEAGERAQSMSTVMSIINAYDGDVLDKVPVNANIPFLSFSQPIAYGAIRSNAMANRYRSLRDLDLDMARLFEKARRFYAEQTVNYGRVLVLQRLYNALTAPYPLEVSGVPQSSTLFASLPAGPGNARSMHETNQELKAGAADVGYGVTTFRVGTKDRIFTSEARHKGQAYRVGDFVHLINPDDATRPIVGQIFKTFVPTKGHRTHHVTVCWYYRPEQTVHTQDRMFYEREVFKTSHFCDHPVEDIIERISVQFYVKWIRGRSKAPEYYPGWPACKSSTLGTADADICHSRYNDRLWLTVRIKNWGSCIPDELRQTDFMAVVPYDRQVEPALVKSPFLRGIKGPGFFGEPKGKEEDEILPRDIQGSETRPTLPSRMSETSVTESPMIPPRMPSTPPVPTTPSTPTRPAPITGWSSSRSVVAVLGGPQVMEQVSTRDILSTEIGELRPKHQADISARLFERDPRGQVLWFSGPPLAPGMVKDARPAHSVEYLEYLTRRRRGDSEGAKRRKVIEEPPAHNDDESEHVAEAWWAEGMTSEQFVEKLKSIDA